MRRPSARLLLTVAFWLLLAAWTWLLILPNPIPEVVDAIPSGWRFIAAKCLHGGTYAVLAIMGWLWPAARRGRLAVAGLLLGHAVATEVIQTYVPNREGCVRDVVIDWVGLGIGWTVVRFVVRNSLTGGGGSSDRLIGWAKISGRAGLAGGGSRAKVALPPIPADVLPTVRSIRLMTLAPGHPDAARVQGRAVEGVHPRCHVYAPLGPDLLDHLGHLLASNARPHDPTRWAADVRAGDDWLDRALREQPGNAAVVTGPADQKLDRLLACVRAGLHVLADEPWATCAADLPRLADLFHEADLRELVVWRLCPIRHDPAVQLLLELAADPDVCGELLPGTPDDPAVLLDATRHLRGTVEGRPVGRPAWAFGPAAGDALLAAGPLADLALRLVLPARPPDPALDLAGVDGTGWPGLLDRDQFAAVTGLADFPPELASQVSRGTLAYRANGTATATLGGVAVRLAVLAEVDPPAGGGDTLDAVVRGRRATLTARGGVGPGELTVEPATAAGPVYAALGRRCQTLQGRYPGLSVQDRGGRFRLATPAAGDGGYAAVLGEFVRYFRSPRQVPAWERAAAVTAAHLCVAASEAAKRKQGVRGV